MAEFNPKLDSILPPVLFQTGDVQDEAFEHIIHILGDSLDVEPSIDVIRETMKTRPQAVVYNKHTGEVYEKPETRICNRHTFDSRAVEAMSPIIIEMIRDNWRDELAPEDIQIEPTHGDILYYPEGGKFNYHRDEKLECPYGEGYDFYSLIMCLDSSGRGGGCDGGKTRVQLPPTQAVMRMRLDPSCATEFAGKHLVTYEFHETVTPQQWVMFPSQSLHSGGKLYGEDSFKMCLKLDVWIKYPVFTEENWWGTSHMWQEDYDEEHRTWDEEERDIYGDYGGGVDECNGYMEMDRY
jgi:hypothetical protein